MLAVVSLPAGECGLKFPARAAVKGPGSVSLPAGECGLKFTMPLMKLWGYYVTPRRGVWIEISDVI